jgi:hypothetical protein
MTLHLSFLPSGAIQGEGIDDVGQFDIAGVFDAVTSRASWNKAYRGKHTVQYSGVYSQRTICGDWTLLAVTGGFWIWPGSLTESDFAEALQELEQDLEPADVKPETR